jgi:hypothetical protein
MPVGPRDAQLAHAIGQSVDGPHPNDTFVVILVVPDEASLEREAKRLVTAGVSLARVIETDGPYTGQLTAVGLHLGRKEALRRFVSSIPLLR